MSKTPVKKESKELARKCEYTEDEKALISKYREATKIHPIRVTEARTEGKNRVVLFDDGDNSVLFRAKLMETTGTISGKLSLKFITQIANVKPNIVDSEKDDSRIMDELNNILALMHGIKPTDEIESMLAIQMICTHDIAMDFLRRSMLSDRSIEQIEGDINKATKLLRTFTAQVEALNKYRNKGQQKVTVEHVTVNEGGQAVVGVVEHKGGGSGGNDKN